MLLLTGGSRATSFSLFPSVLRFPFFRFLSLSLSLSSVCLVSLGGCLLVFARRFSVGWGGFLSFPFAFPLLFNHHPPSTFSFVIGSVWVDGVGHIIFFFTTQFHVTLHEDLAVVANGSVRAKMGVCAAMDGWGSLELRGLLLCGVLLFCFLSRTGWLLVGLGAGSKQDRLAARRWPCCVCRKQRVFLCGVILSLPFFLSRVSVCVGRFGSLSLPFFLPCMHYI